MSTSTDVRERQSEQERSTGNQLTATGLTLVSAGFTLYPTRLENDRLVALGIAAPQARAHRAQLVVQRGSIVGTIPNEMLSHEPEDERAFPDLHFLNVAGFDLSWPGGQDSAG